MAEVKICGIRDPFTLEVAAKAGARFAGLNFYPPSPRYLDVPSAAQLARMAPTGLRMVGVFFEPSDEQLEATLSQVPLDMIQLHGEELPARVQEIRDQSLLPVIKVIRVSEADDLMCVKNYEAVADWLMFDAKPPAGVASLPGGNALRFDWSLLAGRELSRPWMLAGGLAAENVGEAIAACRPTAVDTASGVEDRPGHKDSAKVRAFIAAAKGDTGGEAGECQPGAENDTTLANSKS